ncbi:MAG: 30S ribosomal protein S11 [Candidatus Magasanikbacteria bacterium RIFOXYC2_FULL_40_16]|uniref:Small ribosomal subunit protein uS11 n=3 Tax=Candidatus Magasanikiibacteriota TaxID=1752731 RepID=A0A1F6NG27_9BACT|nr:MAG: 30S ribosomal protein S11 [Candidatus Magasanikbacteria bacterium RIFOXYA2_FULL_40_20]OGH82789.1 MAG: 30S ribosomal protein S11 [Candidatus Magasanikbacteria bacterium RIFOXYB1_FULL_40_15]OGH86973.1 MAG: 30S ribosomal protein S11 [Candidatus Magasanikbacteria bacterium RIFOXYB2_FULL_40_13]OGH87749.1 MAG: 30S ribosomal protein S11 [Candidatus Magasanikbacteria bacterium RIFOXYA1_FULL_40_8]OGH90345.1 MAG: 30S ribosomal protein S11 [Candidatus Magasanikbacteria bacterium RIFOXYC2_FULL_40_1
MVKAVKKAKKKKINKQVSHARAYVQATFNNTIVTLTDQNGDVLGWASSGMIGFKGPKKATPYAAGQVVKKVVESTKTHGVREVSVFIKGIGGGREGAIRGFNANGINVLSIKDITPIPHNGCRAPKRRRV